MLSGCIAFVLATALMSEGSVSAEAAKKVKSTSGKPGPKARNLEMSPWHELVILGDVGARRGGKKKGKKGN
jgi:hypothetical protein